MVVLTACKEDSVFGRWLLVSTEVIENGDHGTGHYFVFFIGPTLKFFFLDSNKLVMEICYGKFLLVFSFCLLF